MLYVTVALIVCIASSTLIAYGINASTLWGKGKIDIREPSIHDLDDHADKYVVDRYVKEVVSKYHDYCTLKSSMEKRLDAGSDALWALACPIISCFALAKVLLYAFSDLLIFWVYAASIVSSLLIAILSHVAISKLFPAPTFDFSRQDLIKSYKASNTDSTYPVSEHASINIYILSRHHWFLFSISKRESTRIILKRIGVALLAVLALVIVI